MKALLLSGPGPIAERPLARAEIEVPRPGPGQVLLRVLACGLCHTDLHIVEGDLPPHKLPLVPGHQVVGVVAEPGGRWQQGERVGVAWLGGTCGQCAFCREGRENLCLQARFTGYDADGGFAQYAVAREDFIYPLPPGFPPLQAAPLLCAGVIGFRALRLSGIQPGGRLGLYGFGASAHIAIQVARHWGCHVLVFTRSPEHRELALGLGAAWAGSATDEPPERLDAAIIFAPAGGLVPQALKVLERGATLALAGIWMSPIPGLDYAQHLYQERAIRSVANSTREDARELLRLAAAIPIRTQVQVFPLEKANEALALLKQGQIQGAGVLQIA